MQYFLYLRSVGLCAQSALRSLNRGEENPCIVHHLDVVYDANHPALQRRITLGMPAKEAKVILQDKTAFIEYKPEDYRTVRETVLMPCLTYSDGVQAGRAGEGLVDLSKHPQPFDIATTLLAELHRLTQLPLIAGIAPSVWLARRAADICHPNALSLGILPIEPITDPALWLAPQPISTLTPLELSDRKKLHILGFDRVSQVQEVSPMLLEQQFPKRGTFIQQTALGKLADPIKPNYPSKMVSTEIHLGNSESSLEIESAFRKISNDLAERLCNADEVAGSIGLTLIFEDGVHVSESKKLPRPTHAANALFISLGQLLQALSPQQSIETIRVRLYDLEASKRRQIPLPICGSDSGAKHHVADTVKRIEATHGTGAVTQASSITQSYNQTVLQEWKRATGWR